MQRSEQINELATALAKAQKVFKPIVKSETVDFTSAKGRTKYNYAPLSEVIEATRSGLADNGLSVMQPTTERDGHVYVETWLCHASGQWVQSEMYVGQFDQPPQSEGSALTYKRRYSLSAILGVASEEDDDGEEASKDKPETIKPKVEVNKSEHWCEKHQVNFRPNRNGGYGHYVGQTKEYCVEHTPKPEPAKEEIFPETDNEESPQSTEPPPVAASGQQTETVQKLTDFDKLMLAVRDVKKALRSDRNVIDWLSATLKVSADEVKADPVKAWLGIRDLIGKAGKEL